MPQIVICEVAGPKTGKFPPEYIGSVGIDAYDQGDIDLGVDNTGKREHLLHRIVLPVALQYVRPALYLIHVLILSGQRRHRKCVGRDGTIGTKDYGCPTWFFDLSHRFYGIHATVGESNPRLISGGIYNSVGKNFNYGGCCEISGENNSGGTVCIETAKGLTGKNTVGSGL
jgi:hypothetical protein